METMVRAPSTVIDGLNAADELMPVRAEEQPTLLENDEGTEISLTIGKWPAAKVRTSVESEMRLMMSPAVAPAPKVCSQGADRSSWGRRSRDKYQGRSR
jgi:hypothetical protein